jgi:hypothetical protein
MLRRFQLLPVIALVLCVASVAAIAVTDQSNPPGQGVAQVTMVEPQAKEAMAVLEAPRTAADALRPDLAEQIDARANFGMNPDLSRLAIGNTTSSVYVIPARDHVCAGLTIGGGADVICPSTEAVAAGKAAPATMTLETGGIGIYGIVPDGVGSVSVRTGASDSVDLETEDNAYYTVVPAGTQLRSVGYAGPSGSVEFPIYDPARVQTE